MRGSVFIASLVFVATCLFGTSFPVHASDASSEAKRLELAQKMNVLRPPRDQVIRAVDQVARALPESERKDFKNNIIESFDFSRLEALSAESMVEVFTVEELEAMVAYYSTPEAKSIMEKLPVYEELVRPEVMKMIDRALMVLRTGRPAQ